MYSWTYGFDAATALQPADYFAINSTPEIFKTLGMHVDQLPKLAQEIGINLVGRTGGAVTLAVGMTDLFGHSSEFPIN
jgi:carbon starvation protein